MKKLSELNTVEEGTRSYLVEFTDNRGYSYHFSKVNTTYISEKSNSNNELNIIKNKLEKAIENKELKKVEKTNELEKIVFLDSEERYYYFLGVNSGIKTNDSFTKIIDKNNKLVINLNKRAIINSIASFYKTNTEISRLYLLAKLFKLKEEIQLIKGINAIVEYEKNSSFKFSNTRKHVEELRCLLKPYSNIFNIILKHQS